MFPWPSGIRWTGRTDKWQLYFSTDDSMDGREVLDYYRIRFQLEFCFRDGKQHAGITNVSQPTSENWIFTSMHRLLLSTWPKAACKRLGIAWLHLSIALESKLSSLCIRFALTLHSPKVRLHLSIALESKLSSLCIRFALTFAQNKQLRHNNAGSNVKIILSTYLVKYK